jgi:cytochrome c biogenesis factor
MMDEGLTRAQRVFMMSAGLLFGGLITVGFLVTPTLFSVLDDKQVAGMIAGEIFKNTSFFSLMISVFLLIYANLLVKRSYLQFRTMRWYLLIAIVLMMIGTFVIQPMMENWREIALEGGAPVMQSPYAQKFAMFHHISSVMFTIEVLISFWVFWTATRLQR